VLTDTNLCDHFNKSCALVNGKLLVLIVMLVSKFIDEIESRLC